MKKLVDQFYGEYYSKVFNEGGLSGWGFRWTHRLLESNYVKNLDLNKEREQAFSSMKILEIGAGKGEHFPFVKHPFDSYHMLDILPEPAEITRLRDPRIVWIQEDISKTVSLQENYYDRVIVMCVLHHLDDVIASLENIFNSTKIGGYISVFLPSDPGILNRVNRKVFVNPRARKLGFNHYVTVNALEHKNHFWSLKVILEEFFRNQTVASQFYPFNISSGNATLFSIWSIQKKEAGLLNEEKKD
jgi:SAM-dependent methyltransferase